MSKNILKRDRTARLLKIQLILWQYPKGLTTKEISQHCSMSARTVYRDLEALEKELNVPLWSERFKYGIAEGYFLPPISFTQAEAMNIFLATRLVQNLSLGYNPSVISTFLKLSTIVPIPLRQQIHNSIEYLEKQPKNERILSNLDKITKAWLSQNKISLLYQDLEDKEPVEHIVDTYFIEPISRGRSSFVIGYSDLKKAICSFKINRIVGDVDLTGLTYEIPSDFNAMDYLGVAWGIYSDSKTIKVKLRFNRKVSKAVEGTTWHQSQQIEKHADGTITMILKVLKTLDFRGWILGWADDVEVLEPKSLRQEIYHISKSLNDIYSTDPKGRVPRTEPVGE